MASKDKTNAAVSTPSDFRTMIQRKLVVENRRPNSDYKLRLRNDGNLNLLHFSCRGPKGTIFEDGLYHGVLSLPPSFPFKPPDVILLTPSGRFETNKKICFSYTSYHPETWSPALGLGSIILGLISLFDAPDEVGIGIITNINNSTVIQCKERNKNYVCPDCGMCHATLLKELKELEEKGVARNL